MNDQLRQAIIKLNDALGILNGLSGAKPLADSGLKVVEKNGKNYIDFENRDWFTETCLVLRAHPTADGKDRQALEDLPSGLNKYGSLTEPQWRLFKALHNKILGSWPNPTLKVNPPVTAMTQADIDQLPF